MVHVTQDKVSCGGIASATRQRLLAHAINRNRCLVFNSKPCQFDRMIADVKEILVDLGQPSYVFLDAGSLLLMDICVCGYFVVYGELQK